MRLPVGPDPRSHGENWMFTPPVHGFAGSSPLTRGKLTARGGGWNGPRLIPAHAGKTPAPRRDAPVPRAHPRSRGENLLHDRVTAAGGGSSPLTRGKPSGGAVLHGGAGLIPAHAGKTAYVTDVTRTRWAHPRSRGENTYSSEYLPKSSGSSPLTRGKLLQCLPEGKQQGLIPAHAGKTAGAA